MELELDVLWSSLEKTIASMDQSNVEWYMAVNALDSMLSMLLSYPPEQVIEKILASRFPPRGIISWVVHEASRIPSIPPEAIRNLCAHWDSKHGSPLGGTMTVGAPVQAV